MTTDLAPLHPSCQRRHSPGLPCWVGRRIKAHLVLVLEEYGDSCCHCTKPGCDSVEHVQPRSRWGTDELANLRPTHMRCNSRRGTRPRPGWGVGGGSVTHSPTVDEVFDDGTELVPSAIRN